MEPVRIDHAAPADVPRLLDIRYAAFARHAPSAYSPEEVATLLNDIDESELRGMIRDGQLFVGRRCRPVRLGASGAARRPGPVVGEVVGLAGWKGANLRHVYVDPEQTRQGIASALLRHVEADLREATGADEIRAGVTLHAQAFYLANGDDTIRRATAWDGSGYFEMTERF